MVGDLSAASRVSAFTANANSTSDLLAGTTVAITGAVFDSVGPVQDVSLDGAAVATSVLDVDSQFLPVRDFPVIASGWEEAALDVLQRAYGAGGATLPWQTRGLTHSYWPLRGHHEGRTVDGSNQPYQQETWGRALTTDGYHSMSWYGGLCACPVFDWVRLDSGVYAVSARPLMNPLTGSNVNFMHLRVRLGVNSSVRVRLVREWSGAPTTTLNVRINRLTGSAGTVDMWGDYREHNTNTLTAIPLTSSDTTGIDMAAEVAFVVQWGYLSAAADSTLRVRFYAYDPNHPPAAAPVATRTVDLPHAMRGDLESNGSSITRTAGTGGFRDVILSTTSSFVNVYPTVTEPDLIAQTFTKTMVGATPPTDRSSMREPIPAWRGSGADYLKHLAAARNLNIRVHEGRILVEDMPQTVRLLSGTVTTPKASVRSTRRAGSVDVIAHESTVSRTFGGRPNWVDDVNITVRLNEEQQVILPLPAGEWLAGAVTCTFTDNTGKDISQLALHTAGARFAPTVNRDGTVTMRIRGPRVLEPYLGEAPWQVTSVRVTNQGVFFHPREITLHTAAADEIATQDKASTVQNPFLTSVGDVFDRGIWAAVEAGDPSPLLSFVIPASRRSDYAIGSLVQYGYTIYRVSQLTHTWASTDVTAVRFTTVNHFDTAALGTTLAEYEPFAEGKACREGFTRPLNTPGGWPAPFVHPYPSESKYWET